MGLFSRIKEFFRNLFKRKRKKQVEQKRPEIRRQYVPPYTTQPSVKQRVFRNVIFKDPFGNPTLTHEIDRIIVRPNGVFCIEDKDWKGDIYGHEDDAQWKQVLGNGDIIHYHPSPIAQNETHRDVLEEIIDEQENDYVIPVVVMAEDNSPIFNSNKVINACDLESFMKSHSSFEPELDDVEFENLCALIRKNDFSSTISRDEHVRNIRRNHPGK